MSGDLIFFIPILLIIVIIGLIIYGLSKRKQKSESSRWLSGKKTMMIFLIYVSLLFLSMVVYYVAADKELSFASNITSEELYRESDELFKLLQDGDINQINPNYVRNNWSFPYEQDQISIDQSTSSGNGWQIMIKRKEQNDGEIDITYYSGPTTINGYDVSTKLDEFVIELNEDVLRIPQSTLADFNYIIFEKPYVASQFNEKRDWMNIVEQGRSVIYLEIPNNLEVLDSSYLNNIEYVY